MSNINDYLKWRGDLSLSSDAFNEVDSMILARFSYLIFNEINLLPQESIESISKKMNHFKNDEFRYNGDKEMISLLGKSERFKNMIVTDFVEHNDITSEKQFSAITVHISDDELYVSYLGTDNSIYGWKEDFNMAFMQHVPAQAEGKEYLENIANKYPNKRIRLGGHSKGGSVAIFASIFTNKEIQNRIIEVVNYDGPGLEKEVLQKVKGNEIFSKLHTYIPQDSIIGRILEHEEKCTVVESTEKGIYQHDIFSWQVLGKQLITLDAPTSGSEFINKSISQWLKSTTPEQRKIFFDGIFEIFYSSNMNTFSELSSTLSKNIPTFIKTYQGISEKDKKIISSMFVEFGKISANILKNNVLNKNNKK